MPANENAPKVGMLNALYFNEVPRTKFVDWLGAIRVRLLNGPNMGRLKHVMLLMKQATWASDPDMALARAVDEESLAGNHPLPQFNEVPAFTFEVSGISRVITHQIVRTRLGVTYSQQGTGDQDRRHDDVLVPRSLCREGNEKDLEAYINHALESKQLYVRLLDKPGRNGRKFEHSLVMARYVLPHNTAQFIYVNINLLALQGLIGNRLCTYETAEYNEVAGQMAARMRETYPELAKSLKANCDRDGGCHYMRAKNPAVAGSMYQPDPKHDVYDWNPADFVYDATRDDMVDGPLFDGREYVGWKRVK